MNNNNNSDFSLLLAGSQKRKKGKAIVQLDATLPGGTDVQTRKQITDEWISILGRKGIRISKYNGQMMYHIDRSLSGLHRIESLINSGDHFKVYKNPLQSLFESMIFREASVVVRDV